MEGGTKDMMKKGVLFILIICFLLMFSGFSFAGDQSAAVAEIGENWRLTKEDLSRIISFYPEERQAALKSEPRQLGRLLKRLVESKVLADAARAEGFDRRPEIMEQLDLMIDDFLARTYAKHEIDKIMSGIKIDEEDLLLYYKTHPEEFQTGNHDANTLLAYDKVKDRIREQTMAEIRKNKISEYIDSALKKAGTDIHYERLLD